MMNDQIKIKTNIDLIDLNILKNKNNYIICEYDVKRNKLNVSIQILNCYEEEKNNFQC